MKSPDSESLVRLFEAAADLPTAERAEFLKSADPDLAAKVRAMLEGAQDPHWNEHALELEARATAFDCRVPQPGDLFGSYRIVRRIAAGGMSFVYEAERDDAEFHKRVAIKFLQQGIGNAAGVERFRMERQILAQLEHPNIARLLDGGTSDDGIPYLVMEFVEGLPIDRFVTEGRLSRTARLTLFLQVCEAVAYAHRNLVVHRDLKPGNILVAPGGTPKLLDFGIAKLLMAESRAQTVTALTPEYASPEQVLARTITTATDIYSLGVLLFVLLADRLPYAASSPGELVRAICEQDIVWHPAGLLDRDLHSILALCLRKEPETRYSSVELLSADLHRYLEGRPVSARSGELRYRAGKFVKRRAIPLAAAAAVLAAGIAGVVSTVAESRRVDRRFNEVRTLADVVLFDAYDSLKDLPGTLAARRLLAGKAQLYLDSLAREAAGDRALVVDLAESYRRLGDVRGGPYGANLGDTPGALETYRKAQNLLEAQLVRAPADPQVQLDLARVRLSIVRVLNRQGNIKESLDLLRPAIRTLELLAVPFSMQPRYRAMLAEAYQHLSESIAGVAERDHSPAEAFEALAAAQKALSIQSVEPQPGDTWQESLAARYYSVGYRLWIVARITGDRSYCSQALEAHLKGHAIDSALAAAHPGTSGRRLADGLLTVANSRSCAGQDLKRALAETQEALGIFQQLASAEPQNAEARLDLGNAFTTLGRVLNESGRKQEALAAYRRALAIFEGLSTADPTNRESAVSVVKVRDEIAALEKQ